MKQERKLTIDDCGDKMSQEESRKVQIDMLNALSDFCDEHGLRYFLSGGTLLGAIRHKGFIPWDDDIDVNMPRPDCEKLLQLTKGKLGKYRLRPPDMGKNAINCESYRLYDFDTVIENYKGGITKYPIFEPIFIDIFPIEGLPDGEIRTQIHYSKIVFLRKMQRISSMDHIMGRNIFAKIFHIISWIPVKLVGYRRWSQMIQSTAMKYDFDKQEYIGVMTAYVHTAQERVKKEDYMKPIDVLFEGKSYHAPANYDTYLSQLYGNDYMQLPPLEKQQSHHTFIMYWRNKK